MKKLLLFAIIAFFAINTSFSQERKCIRSTETVTEGIKVTYSINCPNCGEYSRVRDTITGSFTLLAENKKDLSISLKDNVITFAFVETPKEEFTVSCILVPKESDIEKPEISFTGSYNFLNQDNTRNVIKIENQ